MTQRPLPFPNRETQAERCRRVLAGVPGVVLGSALTFDDDAYGEATELARAAASHNETAQGGGTLKCPATGWETTSTARAFFSRINTFPTEDSPHAWRPKTKI